MAVLRKNTREVQDYESLKPGSILRNPAGPMDFRLVVLRDFGSDRNRFYSLQALDCPSYLYGWYDAKIAEESEEEILIEGSALFTGRAHWEVIKAV